jgi:hypothetical protein
MLKIKFRGAEFRDFRGLLSRGNRIFFFPEEIIDMKVKLGLMIMGCLVMPATSSWAQSGRGPGGHGGGMHYGTMWDASSVTTVAGEVTAVEKYTPGRGGVKELHADFSHSIYYLYKNN